MKNALEPLGGMGDGRAALVLGLLTALPPAAPLPSGPLALRFLIALRSRVEACVPSLLFPSLQAGRDGGVKTK